MSFNIIKSILIAILFFVFVYAPIETNAQGLFKSFDSSPPTGGSGTIINNDSGNSTGTAIFVIGGIAAAAILIFKLSNKDKKEVKKESTASVKNYKEQLSYEIKKLSNNDNPLYDKKIQLYLGIKRETPILNKKTYVVGVSLNL